MSNRQKSLTDLKSLSSRMKASMARAEDKCLGARTKRPSSREPKSMEAATEKSTAKIEHRTPGSGIPKCAEQKSDRMKGFSSKIKDQ
jgi:hypothetical protein